MNDKNEERTNEMNMLMLSWAKWIHWLTSVGVGEGRGEGRCDGGGEGRGGKVMEKEDVMHDGYDDDAWWNGINLLN